MNKKEGGTALVLVLLVVAIITVLGVTSVDRIHYSIKESSDISFKKALISSLPIFPFSPA